MATREHGWLFHLSDGVALPADRDPLFDGEDGVIASRPKDSGVPVIPPDAPPPDDSLANQQPLAPPIEPSEQTPAATVKAKRAKPLLEHVKSHFLHGRVLVVTFTLTARAHVQLLGRRKQKVVASTREETLRPGHHQLSLTLDPARWPTSLQFKANPLGRSAPSSSGGSPGAGPDTVGT
jgi:hypothetical protein